MLCVNGTEQRSGKERESKRRWRGRKEGAKRREEKIGVKARGRVSRVAGARGVLGCWGSVAAIMNSTVIIFHILLSAVSRACMHRDERDFERLSLCFCGVHLYFHLL